MYTDENPKGTIHGLKFATIEDAKASVAKIKKSGKTHAHKIQAAIAMEQRARVMGKNGPASVYRAFINDMKKKTKEMNEKSQGLWANIHAKRRRGEKMRKKGEKGAPTPAAIRSAQSEDVAASAPTVTTASIPNPALTAMGPRVKQINVTDRRRKKDKIPVLLKRFRKYIEDVNEEYYRIDHGNVPKTFSGNQSHGHDDDGNHIKGVYATHKQHSMGHAYAVPRETPWVYHEHEDGKKNLYVHKDHKDKVENHTATVSRFKKNSGFKGLDGGTEENISSKDQTPASQNKIKSGDHIRKQGIKLHYVDTNTFNKKAKQTNAENNGLKAAGNENVK